MKAASTAFQQMLANSQALMMADCYTFTLTTGEKILWTSAQQPITVGGVTYAVGPAIDRSTIKNPRGVQVQSLDITMAAESNGSQGPITIGGLTLTAFAQAGGFDNALVQVDKYLTTSWNDTSAGTINLFTGRVSTLTADRTMVKMTVKSMLVLLGYAWPPNVYLPTCNHVLFDSGCALSASNFAVTGSVNAASSVLQLSTTLTQPSEYFNNGMIQFTSGANNGLRVSVKSNVNGTISLVYPLPNGPEIGDEFTIYPGCDKQASTCQNKFNNIVHFKGYPYVPIPDTIYAGGQTAPQSAGAGNSNSGGGGGSPPSWSGRGTLKQ